MLEIVYVFWIIFAFSMVYSLLSLFVSMGRNVLGLVPSHFKLDIIFLQVFISLAWISESSNQRIFQQGRHPLLPAATTFIFLSHHEFPLTIKTSASSLWHLRCRMISSERIIAFLFIIYYTFIELFFEFCHIFINFASKTIIKSYPLK